MKRLTLFTTACVLAVLALLVTDIRAQKPDTLERTTMTFNTAVELPGTTLQPGTYEFRLADTQSRNVVQVFRQDGKEPVAQLTFSPSQRERATDETVVMFREAPEGTTPAIQYWYYPGDKIGKEFIYPKNQAERIAARTGQSVLSDDGRVSASSAASAAPAAGATASRDSVQADASVSNDNRSTASSSSSSSATDTTLRNAPSAAQPSAPAGSTAGNRGVVSTPEPARAETTVARAEPAAQAAPAPAPAAQAPAPVTPAPAIEPEPAASVAQNQEPRPVGTSGRAAAQEPASGQAAAELPATASPLALSGLIGLASLAAAAGLRLFRA
jgi:hypothetical protein